MNKLKGNRTLLSIVLLGIALVLMLILIVINALDFVESRSKIAYERSLLEATQARAAQLNSLKENEKENNSLVESYRLLLPESADQDALIARIAKASEKYEVAVSAITFNAAEEQENLKKIPFTLSAQGQYNDVVRFVEAVTLDGAVVVMDTFALSGTAEETTIQANCSAYYQQ